MVVSPWQSFRGEGGESPTHGPGPREIGRGERPVEEAGGPGLHPDHGRRHAVDGGLVRTENRDLGATREPEGERAELARIRAGEGIEGSAEVVDPPVTRRVRGLLERRLHRARVAEDDR